MSRVFRGAVAALALVAAVPAAAQDLGALSWLVGRWQGTGTMFGAASEAALDIRPALGGKFLELSYRGGGGFEGRAFYRPVETGGWQAQWFDNRGVTFGISGRVEGQVLTADWGSVETERGRTVYRLMPDGRLEVTDTVATRDGGSREFARHVLTRAE
ncbi:hypothetical protein RCO27_08975 [Sphingosinicella sp. LHD-64]|uniref:hypothetical protein n=1 Tax=Sphingosinicella sp. LHD-64 TaxID=3072139 RepID=UPI00280FA926|nr:hypothetical protein [Sphingosinicella sp. LHD-64]MDQ8756361.1 hypothetical protein [Sphingosinicella sp. LHD-64]